MRPTDYERMRERHHDGVCGGDCPECYVQQREENYREQERWAAYVWAREEQEREERARSQDQHSDVRVVTPRVGPETDEEFLARPRKPGGFTGRREVTDLNISEQEGK